MKIRKQGKSTERQILIGMIVDTIILGQINSKWQPKMFRSSWANLIAEWCLKYYKKYKRAPKFQIENLYSHWVSQAKNNSTIDIIDKFLGSLSDEYENLKEESNSDYVIDVASKYFNQVKIERLMETVQDDIDIGKINKAHNHLSSYNRIEMGAGGGVDVFQDEEVLKEAFAGRSEPLIQYPGVLGDFFSNSLERAGFISFIGPEKRGKSFWLLDIAFRAVYQRRRVAFFEAGDMGQNQVMRRFMTRATMHPAYPCIVDYPVKIYKNAKGGVFVRTREKEFTTKLSWRKAKRACNLIMRKKIKSKKSFFKLSSHPTTTLSVNNIQSILQDWGRQDWVPDVIVIDYADILNMNYAKIEGRDAINETWKQLRSLSQKYYCLVVTATQSDSASYHTRLIDMSNFSNDKRKAGHVTGMIGLNQTPTEKRKNIMRLNWAVDMRDSRSNVKRCIHVAECRALASIAVKSCW